MTQYFYLEAGTKRGPVNLDELRERKISRNTKVWFHPMTDWKPAGEIPELQSLFALDPPDEKIHTPPQSVYSHHATMKGEKPPKTWLVESILATFFCCPPFGIAGIVNAAKVESRFYAGDMEGAKRCSDEARKWTLVSFWLGVSCIVLYILFIAFAAVISH